MPSVLITGANRGLGLELSRLYLDDGWQVIACCREPGAPALVELAAAHGNALARHRLELSDPEQIQALAEGLAGRPLDLLLLNAGVYGPEDAPFGKTPVEEWLEVFRINTVAPLKLTEALVQNVACSERKQIVMVTSLMGSLADNESGGHYPYRSSKAALNMVAKSLSVDLRSLGVTVAVIHPGWVQTDMGGEHAPLTTHEACSGMKRVLDGLQPADSGSFLSWDGERHPW